MTKITIRIFKNIISTRSAHVFDIHVIGKEDLYSDIPFSGERLLRDEYRTVYTDWRLT